MDPLRMPTMTDLVSRAFNDTAPVISPTHRTNELLELMIAQQFEMNGLLAKIVEKLND